MENTNQQKSSPIKVFIRVRPHSKLQEKSHSVVEITQNKIVSITSNPLQKSTIQFDQAFSEKSSQKDFFYNFKTPLSKLLEGYNLTVFAYGQTGSGKTHTMFGSNWQDPDAPDFQFQLENTDYQREIKNDQTNAGLIPRAIYNIFQDIKNSSKNDKSSTFKIYCSFLQIYNEKVYDLFQVFYEILQKDPLKTKPLKIHESNVDGAFVEGLSQFNVTNYLDCLKLLKFGRKNCLSRQTSMNTKSSRSHLIFQLSLESLQANQGGFFKKSKLTLCDLAGSQKIKKGEKMENQQLEELKSINLSLTTLGKVITSLSSKSKQIFAPFRESKLTRLLQQSLTGNTQTFIIGNISPSSIHIDDTMNTLRFAQKARNIVMKIKPIQLDGGNQEIIHQMKQEVQFFINKQIVHLKELLKLKRKGIDPLDIKNKLVELQSENQNLKKVVVQSKDFSKLIDENQRMKQEIEKLQSMISDSPKRKKQKIHVKSQDANSSNESSTKTKEIKIQLLTSRKATEIRKIAKSHESKERSKSELKNLRQLSKLHLPQIHSPKRIRESSQPAKLENKSQLYEPKVNRKQRYSSQPQQIDIEFGKKEKIPQKLFQKSERAKLRQFLAENKEPPYFLSIEAQNYSNFAFDQQQPKINGNRRRKLRKNYNQKQLDELQVDIQVQASAKLKTNEKQTILQKLSELQKVQKINEEKLFKDLEKSEKAKQVARLDMAQIRKRNKTNETTVSPERKVEKKEEKKGRILLRPNRSIDYDERMKQLESKIRSK